MSRIAAIFPGQGSQYVGMGKDFFDSSTDIRKIFAEAEKISSFPIIKLCFEGPLNMLTLTKHLQPAIATVNLACWTALIKAGIEPIAVAGHSLGEYPALTAAGSLSLSDCLKLVSLRSQFMDYESKKYPGSMNAIIGLSPEQVTNLCSKVQGVVQPANYNSQFQTVITGTLDAVAKVVALANNLGAKSIKLNVNGAWHSPLMQEANEKLSKEIANIKFNSLTRIYIPNTTGQPINEAQTVKTELMKQLVSPVYWMHTIKTLWNMGIDTFIEVGPKNILANLTKKIIPQKVTILNIENILTLETALATLKL